MKHTDNINETLNNILSKLDELENRILNWNINFNEETEYKEIEGKEEK